MSDRSSTSPVVRAEDVRKSFGDHEVLSGVSFDVGQGTVTVILGPSGSGKTTLLRSLNGLEVPDSGTVTVSDVTVDFGSLTPNRSGRLPRAQREQLTALGRQSGFVFQAHNLFAHRTTIENVIEGPVVRPDDLAQRILNGLAAPGVHRAIVDLNHWRLLKWLDKPCPFFDWRAGEQGETVLHPGDERHVLGMAREFVDGPTARVLRLPAHGGGFTPIHVTVNRIELDNDTYAALMSMRLPTDEEIAAAEQEATAVEGAQSGTRAALKSLLRLRKITGQTD